MRFIKNEKKIIAIIPILRKSKMPGFSNETYAVIVANKIRMPTKKTEKISFFFYDFSSFMYFDVGADLLLRKSYFT